ncbi:MAG: hypothetical protein RL065_1022 [Bacteroidota bacterium]|jgi:predicted AAA+ superfamily ATPase
MLSTIDFNRVLFLTLNKRIKTQKVSLLLGARRVGKTIVLQQIANKYKENCLLLNGEDQDVRELLLRRSVANYKKIIGEKQLLIIDEAHHIPEIGKIAKLMIDEIKPLHIILSGSSTFNLQQGAGEPLVGRSYEYTLYPIAQCELKEQENLLQTKANLSDRLIYGSYPEVLRLTTNKEKEEYLKLLVNQYLLKDILEFENVKQSDKLKKLLQLLAFQVGSESSSEDMGKRLGISKNTVDRYLDLLTKVFVIFRLNGFGNNLSKEMTKKPKWYFFDNGVRNAIINDFKPIEVRQDVGFLWENYLINERIKANAYQQKNKEYFFWRTYDQQEIDFIEVENKIISAFEFKYSDTKVKIPGAFAKAYPKAAFTIYTKENYLDWVDG